MSQDYSGDTEHARLRGAARKFSAQDIKDAIESAKAAGHVTVQSGKYGTDQTVYVGTNGLTAIVETSGSNAGKLITAWWRQV